MYGTGGGRGNGSGNKELNCELSTKDEDCKTAASNKSITQ